MNKSIMIQGTGSDVGKSVITAAVCRILAQDGYRTAPFKSQNMALNSFITERGGEMGRAQVVQAESALVKPSVDMNPILLKPNQDDYSQVIFRGKAQANMTAKEYFSNQDAALKVIKKSLKNLKRNFDIIVLEGAGSPAEINLREQDIVNMKMSKMAQAPVLLTASIEKGGVFASIVGTLELLTSEERERIKGIIINKFRGDQSRFKSGIEFIEEYTGKPVLGTIPYTQDIKLPEEDGLRQNQFGDKQADIKIAVFYPPHISNFTDFDALAYAPDVHLKYIKDISRIEDPDLVIIPGSKNTIEDLEYFYKKGFIQKLQVLEQKGKMIIGICGGFQMLGNFIKDPQKVESKKGKIRGAGLLNIETVLESEKITSQVKVKSMQRLPFEKNKNLELENEEMEAFEIHQGYTELKGDLKPLFKIKRKNSERYIQDGTVSRNKRIWGTYLHGLFNNDNWRRQLINYLRRQKGIPELKQPELSMKKRREKSYQDFADLVRENLDMDLFYNILNKYGGKL